MRMARRLGVHHVEDRMNYLIALDPQERRSKIFASAAPKLQIGRPPYDNVDAARDELIGRGVNVSEVFHYAGGPFNNSVEKPRIAGRDPEGRSYFSFASFEDPDGNCWLLQEITRDSYISSASDLASALRRAEAAHGEHEKRTGERDANWPDWMRIHGRRAGRHGIAAMSDTIDD